MTQGTGPTRRLGPKYLSQLSYQPGDTSLCCGHEINSGPIPDCTCQCHDMPRLFRALLGGEPKPAAS